MDNVAKLDNYSKNMQKYTPKLTADQYYTLDTTVSPTQTAVMDCMNGRQGDNLRSIPIAFVDGDQPHDLTNTKIELRVRDAAGVVKVSNKIINMVDARGGLVLFGVPAQFYESPGEIQRAYFVLQEKTLGGEDQTISTVNVDFQVLENGIDITKAQSKIYVSALDKVINEGGSYAITNDNNKFTQTNEFNVLKAQHFIAPELDELNSNVAGLTASISYNSEAISNVNTQAVANSSAVVSVANSVKATLSNLPETVDSVVDKEAKSLADQISNAESSAVDASANASTAIQLVNDKADQDSLDSLSEQVSQTNNSINLNIASTTTSVANLNGSVLDLSNSVTNMRQDVTTASSAASQAVYNLNDASNNARKGSALMQAFGFLIADGDFSDFSTFAGRFKRAIESAQSDANGGF